MNTKIIFKPAAIDDVKRIKQWYKLQKEGLENKFTNELKQCVNLLKKQPMMFQLRHESIRALPLKQFPYLVYYIFENNTIIILAVFAARQDHYNMIEKLLR